MVLVPSHFKGLLIGTNCISIFFILRVISTPESFFSVYLEDNRKCFLASPRACK